VNRENELIYLDKKRCLLDEASNLKQERIIDLIKEYQWRDEVKYKLDSLFRYNIDLNPEEISDFVHEPGERDRFLSAEKYLNNIHYNSSIHMLQHLNALYVLFIEEHTHLSVKLNQTKRIKMTIKHQKTLRNKKNLKIKKEIN
jgi:hypothetical protein